MANTEIGQSREYFRRDQRDGISPPDLSKECTYAEHIVHTRGMRTQLTSVSLDLAKIRDLGESSYKLEQQLLFGDGHGLLEYDPLLDELKRVAREGEKAERLRAIQAVRYAMRRKEGLVEWSFDTKGVTRKDLITWARAKVQVYFTRLH